MLHFRLDIRPSDKIPSAAGLLIGSHDDSTVGSRCGDFGSNAIRPASGAGLDKYLGAGHVERVIDKRFHASKELQSVRQVGVRVERSFIHPARVDVEEPRIAGRAKGVNTQAPYFFARAADDIAHCFCESIFTACAGMKTTKNE
jgi:hypothetical protein